MAESNYNTTNENASSKDDVFEKLSNKLNSIEEIIHKQSETINQQSIIKDETINRLQKIVYEYEKGFVNSIKEPLLKDLILFKDSFTRFKIMFAEASEVITKEIKYLEEELDEIFYAHNLEVIVAESNKYDRNIQIVRKTVICQDENQDKEIIEILKEGYTMEGKMIRKQEVSIYTYQS